MITKQDIWTAFFWFLGFAWNVLIPLAAVAMVIVGVWCVWARMTGKVFDNDEISCVEIGSLCAFFFLLWRIYESLPDSRPGAQ